MGASQALVARDILDAYPLKPHAHLLDVGGGEGAFAVEAARSAPALRVSHCSTCRRWPPGPNAASPPRGWRGA